VHSSDFEVKTKVFLVETCGILSRGQEEQDEDVDAASQPLFAFPHTINCEVNMRPNFADDDDDQILRGCPLIARAIGTSGRRCYALLEAGVLPAWKEIGVWVSTKRRLHAHYHTERHPKAKPPDKPSDIAGAIREG
jgi:hypothetical protein